MTPAITALDDAGVSYALHEYDHADTRRDFGLEAAEVLGLDPSRVFKTLIVSADGEPAVAIAPVSASLALKAVARALGAKRAEMCDPAVAERVTGSVRGGISPFGQKQHLPTLLDDSAAEFDTIYVSGGKRGLDVEVAVADVVRLTAAIVAPISAIA